MSEVMRRIAFGSEGNALQDPSCRLNRSCTTSHHSEVACSYER